MAESNKIQVCINVNDLHCSVCHEALYNAVALPCMHRFCDKCVFYLNECALCRKDIDNSVPPQPDHFIQTLARENIKELPLCGNGCALGFNENLEHRNSCITCLRTMCFKNEENMRLVKNRCYHLLSSEMDTDSDDDEVVLRVRGAN
jgi:hypothetical protein